MFSSSVRTQLTIGVVLAILMGVTRGYHFPSFDHLPSASWVVFFLAGIYLHSRWVFPALLAEAALLDVAAVTWGGVSNFCVSPAYGFLLPAYGTLWFAGHWYAGAHRDAVTTLRPLTVSLLGRHGCLRTDLKWKLLFFLRPFRADEPDGGCLPPGGIFSALPFVYVVLCRDCGSHPYHATHTGPVFCAV